MSTQQIVDTNMRETELGPTTEKVRQSRAHYRRWTHEQKRQIVVESYEAGASVSIVARRHDVNANQVFHWRQLYKSETSEDAVGKMIAPDHGSGFIPLGIVAPQPMEAMAEAGTMTIACNAMCITVGHDVDAHALRRVLLVVRGLS